MEKLKYIRVARQDVSHDALERQRQTIDDRAREAGCMITESVDEVHGGLTVGPMLEEVILRAKAGEIAEIHVASIDRLSRDPRVVHEILVRLGNAGAKLVTDLPDDFLQHWLAVLGAFHESPPQTISRARRARREARG